MRLAVLHHRGIVVAVLAALVSSGCATMTARLTLDYQPPPERKGPLSTIPPRAIALKVDDQRPDNERNRVGNKKNGFGMVMAPVLSTRDVRDVIFDALKRELEQNGHRVTADGVGADAVVTTTVKRYWTDMSLHVFDVEMMGILNADVAVTSERSASPVLVPIRTTFREGVVIVTDGAFDSVLNKTLAEFIRNFSRDPALLDALREAK